MFNQYNSVSFIIPIYEVDILLLNRCLSTISKQTNNNYEVILVFDGRYYNIDSITVPYNLKDKLRTTVIDHDGTFEARKAGIRLAKNDIIFELDPDDTVSPLAVEYTLNYMNLYECDLYEQATIEVPYGITVHDTPDSINDIIESALNCTGAWAIKPISPVYSRELGIKFANSKTIHDFILAEDVYEMHFLLNNCNKFHKVEDHTPLYLHYYGTGISTKRNKNRRYAEDQYSKFYDAMLTLYDESKLSKIKDFINRAILKYEETVLEA